MITHRGHDLFAKRVDNHSYLQLEWHTVIDLLEAMYVCVCHGVTEKDIKEAAEGGVTSLSQLQTETGCSSGCGSCADVAVRVLMQAQQTPDFLKIQGKPSLSIPLA